jgi:phenylalanyl-tRNA synthetase beta chain
MVVKPSTARIRPYVVCAVLRGVEFTPRVYDSFIELQEKLHQNLCRGRTLVAIGTHDLDTLQGPFRYDALPPQSIKFVPLTETDREFTADRLLQHYREDASVKHLEPYTHIIYDSPVYPVIYDSNDTVLSLPPIINGRHSRIQLHTKNVFIECTATDQTKANIVLDTIVCTYSQYCSRPFTVEPVRVVYEETGREVVTPQLRYRTERAKVSEVNGLAGINITPEEMCRLCERMQLGPARYVAENDEIEVTVPPTRSDILHAVDVIEDVAIAHGYNNIAMTVPKTQTVGAALPINHFCDLLRDEIGRAGYVEMLTHGLCSRVENFTSLRRPIGPAVSLSNPQNEEYEVVRTTLLPGALKTLQFNRAMSFREGIKLFEVSDVVVPCDNEIGAQNVRRLVALYSGMTAGFEIIHGLVDRLMILSQIAPEESYALTSMREEEYTHIKRMAREGFSYYIRPSGGTRAAPFTGILLLDVSIP